MLDKFTFAHCTYQANLYKNQLLIPPAAISFALDGEALPTGVAGGKFKQPIESKYLTPEQFPFIMIPDTGRGYAFSTFFGFKVLGDTSKVQIRKAKE